MALFFNQRKPREFKYSPRFYDPEAEEREERKKIVLGAKYKAPGETDENKEYIPGALIREHIAARRGNTRAADAMRRRRRKQRSVYVLVGMLVLIALIVWMLYFK